MSVSEPMPTESADRLLPDSPECPFCDGSETELHNAFGAHASVSSYWCRECRSPFELMRWRARNESGKDGA